MVKVMRENKKLIIIVPCYNEEETLEYTTKELTKKIEDLVNEGSISGDSGICFVNDGSSDNTSEILSKLADSDKRIALINLSRNFGHQYALLAGMKTVNADMVITVDADLQDSLDSMDEMVAKYHEGYEIVYGCREKRNEDTFLKKTTATLFYKIMKICCKRIYYNHADYRLMSRKALELLKEYNEKVVFLRGLIPHIGLKSATVYYDRASRIFGKTKYNYAKMFELAWRGITNYSIFPIRFITIIGLLFIVLAILAFVIMLIYFVIFDEKDKLIILISAMGLFSGFIMFSIGILGEYIAKILYEVKGRPSFQIESTKNI